jgi:hypothetical protein
VPAGAPGSAGLALVGWLSAGLSDFLQATVPTTSEVVKHKIPKMVLFMPMH